MQDGNFSADSLRGSGGVRLTQFAVRVMAKVAAREDTAPVALRESVVVALLQAALSADPAALAGLRPDLRRARISNEVLADHYIPEVARRLGRGWEDDWATFAQVSIGSARLQALLRDIGANWAADGTDAPAASTVLLIVPGNEQHTMGALVAAGWLRRKGISVCVRIAPSIQELAEILAQCRFDGVMISVACVEMLEVCSGMIDTLRQCAPQGTRIALGGAVLERGEGVAVDLKVDIVTNNLSKAVEALGLTCRRPATPVIT